MTTAQKARTVAALALLTSGLIGCGVSNQFTGMMRYGNLMTEHDADLATRNAQAQLLALATAHGLEVRAEREGRLHFIARAPRYTVTQPDGAVEERIDGRLVHVEAFLDKTLGGRVYRYTCWVEGLEPPRFDDDDRARFGIALLAVREIFEKPIATDILEE